MTTPEKVRNSWIYRFVAKVNWYYTIALIATWFLFVTFIYSPHKDVYAYQNINGLLFLGVVFTLICRFLHWFFEWVAQMWEMYPAMYGYYEREIPKQAEELRDKIRGEKK